MIPAAQLISLAVLVKAFVKVFGRSGAAVTRGMSAGILANTAAFLFLTFVVGDVYLIGTSPSLTTVAIYVGITFAIGLAILGVLTTAYRHGTLVPKHGPWTLRQIIPITAGAGLGALIAIFTIGPYVVTNGVDNVTADQLIFVLSQGAESTTDDLAQDVVNLGIAPLALATVSGASVGLIRSDLVRVRGGSSAGSRYVFRHVRGMALTTMLALVTAGVWYAFATLPLTDVLRQRFVTSMYVQEHFVTPTEDLISLPDERRNLIHIYMESIENSFYSAELGGYQEYNIMPELAELSDTGVSFSNTTLHGGPQQLYATGHSIAAMVSMWAGTPMLSSGAGDGSQMSYPDFPTIGDILHADGYVTDFMVGSDSRWGGLGDYYRRHGDFTVHDLSTFREVGRIPPDYKVWWGVEDDKLYEYAKDVLTERGTGDLPFYFILENADTHWPDGYASPNMTATPFPTQYENVVNYSQAQVVALVSWIQDQPWADNTTIVVTGDHRSMDKKFFEDWDTDYNRTVVNFILNPVQGTDLPHHITTERQYAPMDYFPTILAAIGADIDGERLGLGTNLFSGEPTLVELHGADRLNNEFRKRSLFYDSHRETEAENPDPKQDNKF